MLLTHSTAIVVKNPEIRDHVRLLYRAALPGGSGMTRLSDSVLTALPGGTVRFSVSGVIKLKRVKFSEAVAVKIFAYM